MEIELWGLFLSAFAAATLLPGGSEAVLAALVYSATHPPALLLGVATLGNTLGGMSTWLLGRLVARRYPLRPHTPRRQQAAEWLRRWGSPALLLSWLPLIGDALCFAAGWLRLPATASALFMAIGKAARYAAVLYVFQS
ncbi:MAG TPA: YqaA family protein [Acidiferrobacterales bacterium]